MIDAGHDLEILDPDQLICTLDEGAGLSMELTVANGKGYVAAAQNRPEDAPIGLIPVDSIFSPVRRVATKVENARVGQMTDYDKLILDVETDGSITPEDAVALAARFAGPLSLFVNFEELTSAAGAMSAAMTLASPNTSYVRWTSWSFRCALLTA